MRRATAWLFGALATTAPAFAHPGEAPWEASGLPGRDNCASCHFEAEPVRGSESLVLSGLPAEIEPGHVYDVTVRLKHAGMKVAGFLIAATGGAFEAGAGVEPRKALARSTLLHAKQEEMASWTFGWRAPDDLAGDVAFYLSANAGNDDQSPFGDTIYLDVVKPGK